MTSGSLQKYYTGEIEEVDDNASDGKLFKYKKKNNGKSRSKTTTTRTTTNTTFKHKGITVIFGGLLICL